MNKPAAFLAGSITMGVISIVSGGSSVFAILWLALASWWGFSLGVEVTLRHVKENQR